ncbi:glycosyltransferase [Collinsella tanakaei]|uniref:glycosyltransferase n=1 Tax=Collinsella tanakaei TaxID=626935 RepID=UPI001F173969|nr:glycosyltransferase [Collinsella tanakaei]MCF2622200.1 glycosyltransferase [Collinsella tanakaei]
MKITCLIDSLVSGGAQRQLINLAKLLKDSGHVIDFLVYRDHSFFAELLHSFGITEVKIQSTNNLDLLIKVRKYLKSTSPDVLISFLETPNFIACFSSMGKHSWKLITNELSAKEASFTSQRAMLFKRFEKYSDAIVCNSKQACKLWNQYLPQYSQKMRVIYNPLVIEESALVAPLWHPRRAGKLRIVVTASYQYLKNPVELARAVLMLDERERSVLQIDWYGRSEVVKGDTRAFDETESIVSEYGISGCLRLHEAIHDIYPAIASADIVGLFSTVEGLPNAICEGMYFGKPIVMTPISDFEILAGHGNGIIADGFDAPAIASALKKAIALSDDEIINMGEKSRELALSMFAPDIICEQWNTLLRDLTDEACQ